MLFYPKKTWITNHLKYDDNEWLKSFQNNNYYELSLIIIVY